MTKPQASLGLQFSLPVVRSLMPPPVHHTGWATSVLKWEVNETHYYWCQTKRLVANRKVKKKKDTMTDDQVQEAQQPKTDEERRVTKGKPLSRRLPRARPDVILIKVPSSTRVRSRPRCYRRRSPECGKDQKGWPHYGNPHLDVTGA